MVQANRGAVSKMNKMEFNTTLDDLEFGRKLIVQSVDDVQIEPKKDKLPNWISCGSGSSYEYFDATTGVKRTMESYPYEAVLMSLTPREAEFYSLILSAYDMNTGLSIVPAATSATDRVKYSNAYTKLKSKQLVKRVKKECYLINPKARVNLKLYKTLQELWDKTN